MNSAVAAAASTFSPSTDHRVILLEDVVQSGEHSALLCHAGITVTVADDAADLLALIGREWESKAVIVADLALLPPESLAWLSRGTGPKLLAIVGDNDTGAAGIAMAANLAGFLPRDVSPYAYVAAVEDTLASLAVPSQVAELSDTGIARIGALSAEVERIVTALATLAAGERRITAGGPLPVTAVQVRAIIKARRLRDRFFPAVLFADPVWDMLLDLTAARLEAKAVAVSSLCLAAAVPTTTALRQIKALCDAGMFVRHIDEQDARRTFIALNEAPAQAMLDYLGSLRGDGPVI